MTLRRFGSLKNGLRLVSFLYEYNDSVACPRIWCQTVNVNRSSWSTNTKWWQEHALPSTLVNITLCKSFTLIVDNVMKLWFWTLICFFVRFIFLNHFVHSHVTLMVCFKANFFSRTITYYLVLNLFSSDKFVSVLEKLALFWLADTSNTIASRQEQQNERLSWKHFPKRIS